jgi:hypothetical protein
MSIWTYRGMFRENELSLFGKSAIAILAGWIAVGAFANIFRGEVRHPAAFFIVFVGLVLFLVAKISVISRKETSQFWYFAHDREHGQRLSRGLLANSCWNFIHLSLIRQNGSLTCGLRRIFEAARTGSLVSSAQP